MKYHDLCWKGVHASEMGVIVTDQVCYKRPAMISNTVTVPGRSGTLTISQDTAYDVVPSAREPIWKLSMHGSRDQDASSSAPCRMTPSKQSSRIRWT